MLGPLSTLIAYFLGSIPFGYLIVRWQKGIDVRRTGSGSIGATNVMRNLGIIGFAATFLLDLAKGGAAVLLAAWITGHDPRWVAAGAVAAIVGHCFPLWLKFRGGKGVATAVGVFVVLAPLALGLALLIFAVVVGIWRYVSLGSILAAAAFPALAYYLAHPPTAILVGSVCGAALIIARHHGNIRRLLSGTENRLGKKKAEAGSP
jgi:glycerol-3-phosphate acyltransferase PlsY